MREVLAPAIRHARAGFAVTPVIGAAWARGGAVLADQPGFAAVFLPGGRAPAAGESFANPRLAETLERIANEGPDVFYRGAIAETIDAFCRRVGCALRREDLARHTSDWVDPVSTTFRGHEVWELPPAGQGIAALQMLNLLEPFDLEGMGWGSADHLHLLIEAKKIAYEDRARFYADPAFEPAPVERADLEGLRRRTPRAARPRARLDVPPARRSARCRTGDTVCLATADERGQMVSLIQSNYRGFGSRSLSRRIWASACRIADSSSRWRADHPNRLEGGKRPFHTIIPGFVTRDEPARPRVRADGGRHAAAGARAGAAEPARLGRGLAGGRRRAARPPRRLVVAHGHPDGPTAGLVALEPGFDPAVIGELERAWHRLHDLDRAALRRLPGRRPGHGPRRVRRARRSRARTGTPRAGEEPQALERVHDAGGGHRVIRTFLIASCLFALCGLAAHADSWGPPQPLLASSEDGGWYAAFNPGEGYGHGQVLLVRRAPGQGPRAAPEKPKDFASQAPAIEPEEGDTVVARASTHVPMEIRCLNGGKGFVLFDTYAGVGTGIVLARYDGEGTQRWTKRLGDFFTPAQINAFLHTVSSIWWSEGVWIDESRGAVVVAYELEGPKLLEVDLGTGRHRAGSPASVLSRLGKASLEEQVLALDLAARLRPPGVLEVARGHFARSDLAPEVRIRLAVLMAQEGDHRGDEYVLRHVAKGQPQALRQFALRSLPVILGEDALPHLRDAMRKEADEGWHAAMQGFQALGARAVPTLIQMVGEEDASSDSRGGAASVLGGLEPLAARPAVPALLEAARTAPEYVANAALNALVEILRPSRLGPQLVTLLAAGSGDDGRIALYFREHPRRDAVRALEVARVRHRDDEDPTTRQWIEEALAKCRRGR